MKYLCTFLLITFRTFDRGRVLKRAVKIFLFPHNFHIILQLNRGIAKVVQRRASPHE